MIKYVGYNIPRDSFRLYRSTIVRSDYKFFFIYIYLSKKLLKTRKLKSKTEWNSIAVENSIAQFLLEKNDDIIQNKMHRYRILFIFKKQRNVLN